MRHERYPVSYGAGSMDLERLLLTGVFLAAVTGCGGECDSVSRFTDKNGLIILIVCGETQTLPPPTPSVPAAEH